MSKTEEKVVEVELTKIEEGNAKGEEVTTSKKKKTPYKTRQKRITNKEFFSKDVLGYSNDNRDKNILPLALKSRAGKDIYKLTYEKIDSYFHRPKEFSTLVMAKEINNEVEEIISLRLTELDAYVNKRLKQVEAIYSAATAIELYEVNDTSILEVKAPFSSGHSFKYLRILKNIDEACYMAGYLERTGEFTLNQETKVVSQLYQRSVDISRNLMSFIAKAIIGIKSDLKSKK